MYRMVNGLFLDDEDDDEMETMVLSLDSEKRKENNKTYKEIWSDNSRFCFFFKNPFCRYYLTKSEIVLEQGLLKEISTPIPLYRIIKISLTRNLFQRFFGIGDIKITTHSNEYILKNILAAKNVNALLLKNLNEDKRDKVKISYKEESF